MLYQSIKLNSFFAHVNYTIVTFDSLFDREALCHASTMQGVLGGMCQTLGECSLS